MQKKKSRFATVLVSCDYQTKWVLNRHERSKNQEGKKDSIGKSDWPRRKTKKENFIFKETAGRTAS